jgi:DNA-binding response OmpR family regulator
LTAKTSESDVSACFDVGADDYVTKPFSIRALMRRLDAVLLRNECHGLGVYEQGVIKIDFIERRVFRNDAAVQVAGFDFALLSVLAASPGQIKTNQELAVQLWKTEERLLDWTFDLTSRRLQQLASLCSDVIEVLPNNGYRFVDRIVTS